MKELRIAVFSSAVLLAVACGDRLAIDDTPLEPLCMRSTGTMGYWLDGSSQRVHHEGEQDQISPYACTCITEVQFWDEAESERLRDELLDEVLIECKRSAALEGFDWDDCQEDYYSGTWQAHLGVGGLTTPFSCGGEGWSNNEDPTLICELGDPGCSCTVEAVCLGGTICVDGMCQTPP